MTIWLSQNLHIGVKISHKLCQNTEFNTFKKHMLWIFVCLFVYVEVLWPSQPNGVMSSAISLHNHTFTARNWQLPFLNQQKGENDHRKYFMINLYERMLLTSAGVQPATSWSPVGRSIQLSHRGRQGYLLELAQWGNSYKYPKHMFYEEIRTKQDLSYTSICSLSILYNS